jgi:hypothetical protein
LGDLDFEARNSINSDLPSDPPYGRYAVGHHRDHIQIHVEEAQRAITTWIASQKDGGLYELVEPEATESQLRQIQSDNPGLFQTLADLRHFLIDDRLRELQHVLNAALSSFSMGIGDLTTRLPTVYSVSFLQMYNHMVERATLRRCANEPCSKSFVRQRGRAKYGQHKTQGVQYCSRECARAQAQRELRRRRRLGLAETRENQTQLSSV